MPCWYSPCLPQLLPRLHSLSKSGDSAAQQESQSQFELIANHCDNDETAKRISDLIDDEIKKDSARRREVKGSLQWCYSDKQSKSTFRKRLQFHYAPSTLDYERPVVYLNVIKAIRMILDELDFESSRARAKEDFSPMMEEAIDNPADNSNSWSSEVDNTISELHAKLLPLVAIENSLASELSGGVSIHGQTGYVRSDWQALATPSRAMSDNQPAVRQASEVITLAGRTLDATVDAIESLWDHHSVKHLVNVRQLRLEESATFFLDNIHRIAKPDYVPTNDNILSARLQTLGVTELTISGTMGAMTYDWNLYDVGGVRGQRHAWVPYFDNATTIIFMTSLSAFDQYLEEDSKTNRIDDSVQLFTAICSNKLLRFHALVLLLNKTDLLKKKLEGGVEVKKYIENYGERPNTFESVSDYFRTYFTQGYEQKNVLRWRCFFIHYMSMLDVGATQHIIADVREVIMRNSISRTVCM